MHHVLKIHEHFADAIVYGGKSFEVRHNDRSYQKGDTVSFELASSLIEPTSSEHPILGRVYKVTYVLYGFEGLKERFVAFGIKEDGNGD